mgnify:CR=1 FL=1
MNQWTVFESNHLLDTTLKSLQVRSDLEVLYWSKFQNEKAIMSIQQTIYIKETVCLTHQVLMPKNEKWSFERNVTCIETQRKAIEILTFLLMKSQILLMRITDPLSNWKMMATILQIPKTFQTKKNRTIISQIKIKSRNNHHKNKTKEINNSKIRTKRKNKSKSRSKRNKRRRKKLKFKKKKKRNLKRNSKRNQQMKTHHCYKEILLKWETKKLTSNKSWGLFMQLQNEDRYEIFPFHHDIKITWTKQTKTLGIENLLLLIDQCLLD